MRVVVQTAETDSPEQVADYVRTVAGRVADGFSGGADGPERYWLVIP